MVFWNIFSLPLYSCGVETLVNGKQFIIFIIRKFILHSYGPFIPWVIGLAARHLYVRERLPGLLYFLINLPADLINIKFLWACLRFELHKSRQHLSLHSLGFGSWVMWWDCTTLLCLRAWFLATWVFSLGIVLDLCLWQSLDAVADITSLYWIVIVDKLWGSWRLLTTTVMTSKALLVVDK